MSDEQEIKPLELIPELCRQFYKLGWASGTGGGISIRIDGRIYVAPSGVQKERIKPEDMFILSESDDKIIQSPTSSKLRISECLGLFKLAFEIRDAGCCLHSHSIYASLITSLHETLSDEQRKEGMTGYQFVINNQEVIKGIKRGSSGQTHKNTDTIVVPIIDNVIYERDLIISMRRAIIDNPDTNAVLVRNHGVYVWGRDWRETKSQAECYDYLFRLKLEAHRLGLNSVI